MKLRVKKNVKEKNLKIKMRTKIKNKTYEKLQLKD